MSNIFLLEAVNLFLGDDDPTAGKHLVLESLALPELEYVTVDHMGGGAAAEVSLSMNVLRKIEPTFKLAGFDKDSYRLFAVGASKVHRYTAYGVIRSKRDGKAIKAKAVLSGAIGRVAPDAFDRGKNMLGHDHRIIEVTHYALTVGGEEWFFYDYFTSRRRRLGVDELAETRTMLGLQ